MSGSNLAALLGAEGLVRNRNDPRAALAQRLMKYDPPAAIYSTGAGLASALAQGATGIMNAYTQKQAGDSLQADKDAVLARQAQQDAQVQQFMQGLGGLGGPQTAPDAGLDLTPQPGGQGAPASTSGAGSLFQAVHQLESGGRMTPGIMGDGGQAAGPMQVHPAALADVNAKLGTNYTHEQLAADPAIGRKVGEAYLGMQRERFGRDDYAMGAFNAGPGAMQRAIDSGQGLAGLPASAQGYVQRGMGMLDGGERKAAPLLAGLPPASPQQQAMADRLRQQALVAAGSGIPRLERMAPILNGRAQQIEAQLDRADSLAFRQQQAQDRRADREARASETAAERQQRVADRQQQRDLAEREFDFRRQQATEGKLPEGYRRGPNGAERIPGLPEDVAGPNTKAEGEFRGEFTKLTADFRTIQEAHAAIKESAKSATGPGDMSMLYQYMKLLDPGSVVRESEFAMAAQAGSLPERIQGAASRVLSGEKLPDSLRKQFVDEADNILRVRRQGYDQMEKVYRGLAERAGARVDQVVLPFARETPTPQPPPGFQGRVGGTTTVPNPLAAPAAASPRHLPTEAVAQAEAELPQGLPPAEANAWVLRRAQELAAQQPPQAGRADPPPSNVPPPPPGFRVIGG